MHTTKEATRNKGVHHERSVARRKAVQLLYQAQIRGQSLSELLESSSFIEEIGIPPRYSCELIRGLDAHLQEVDSLLEGSSNNWALDRMPLVDRCILRLAVYELRFENTVPVSVSINEAIELAREFGGKDGSSSFVNGVLGNIARGGCAQHSGAPDDGTPSDSRLGGTACSGSGAGSSMQSSAARTQVAEAQQQGQNQ
ncbi:MAG: transcription antitermination factor NusB [Coriobacteriales bacterium]|jgi:N utilization substance protein B|nr:transcription antitermination factor NusB [Coriobacteriales bacterium]